MAGIILSALLLATAEPAPPPPAPAKLTLQQRFDAASQAGEEGRCSEAVTAFEALEQMPAAMKAPIVRAAVSVRKGICLVKLGNPTEGEAAIQQGLPALTEAGDNFSLDVVTARLALGKAAHDQLDYERAGGEYRKALALAQGPTRLRALFGLAQVSLFDPGPEPLSYIDQAMQIVQATPAMSKDLQAQLMTLKARILLNRGEHEAGYALLKDALKLQGGLTLKVSLADIATRSDLAIAAMLLKKSDDARNYLAYTGAGLMDQAPFSFAENMDAPLCGATSGLTPADYAVVEFSIADDGSAFGIQPIYSTGGRDVALAFARAVTRWSWINGNVKEIKPFFRYAMRVEMRCTTVGERPNITEPITARFSDWAAPFLTGSLAVRNEYEIAAQAGTLLDQARKKGDDNATIALLGALILNPVTGQSQDAAYADEALQLAEHKGAPAGIINWFRLQKTALAQKANQSSRSSYRAALRQLLPAVLASGDDLAINSIRLMIASPGYRLAAPEDAPALLDAVIADSAMSGDHPLKVNALLQRASLAAQKKDFALAQKSFEQTGLSTEQCAFIGAAPALRRSGVSSADYPIDAMRMGFEGWVRVEFDVDATGHTRQPRALIAYPPFVFANTAAGMAKDFVYESSYRPGGDTACAGAQQNINFRMNAN